MHINNSNARETVITAIKSVLVVRSVQKMEIPTTSCFGEVCAINMLHYSSHDTIRKVFLVLRSKCKCSSENRQAYICLQIFSASDLWLCTSERSFGDSEKNSLMLMSLEKNLLHLK